MQGRGVPPESSCGLDEQCWEQGGGTAERVQWLEDQGAECIIQAYKSMS